ncbi:uncharacterized protein G2W53_040144 [Senna tora]|uniref:Uncharacterized protein n=1 Tax=Senna tora TaxID=362788 RepID=A0A834SNY3_9FABA|nr:uncharacterized protein G2W53_040144 [Senna tora]
MSSWISKGSFDKKPFTPSVPDCFCFANPTFNGSIVEAWFDSVAVFDSHCDDDYKSVPDDVVSGSLDKKPITPDVLDYYSFANPPFHRSIKEAWFDFKMLYLILIVMMTTRVFLMTLCFFEKEFGVPIS